MCLQVKEKGEAKAQRDMLEERVAKMAEKLKRLDKIRRLNEQRQKWEAVHKPVTNADSIFRIDFPTSNWILLPVCALIFCFPVILSQDGQYQGPGKGGTATDSTLLYDRFAAGFAAKVASVVRRIDNSISI